MKMTLPYVLEHDKWPVLDAVYWCPVREAFFRFEHHDGKSVWVAYTAAGSYPPASVLSQSEKPTQSAESKSDG